MRMFSSFLMANPRNDLSKLHRCQYRLNMSFRNNRLCNWASKTFFPKLSKKLGHLINRQAINKIRCRNTKPRAHPHIKRRFFAKAKSSLRRLKLMAGKSKIKKGSRNFFKPMLVYNRVNLAKISLYQNQILANRIFCTFSLQFIFDMLHRFWILVNRQYFPATLQNLKRMTSASQS